MVEITKQGARCCGMMPEHAEFTKTLTIDQCKEKAVAFLTSRGFSEMADSYYQVYNGLAVINYAAMQGMSCSIRTLSKYRRMDTGDIVGFEAN
jgi:hypothetical protein